MLVGAQEGIATGSDPVVGIAVGPQDALRPRIGPALNGSAEIGGEPSVLGGKFEGLAPAQRATTVKDAGPAARAANRCAATNEGSGRVCSIVA